MSRRGANDFASQSAKTRQPFGKQDRSQVGNVVSSVGLSDNDLFITQPSKNTCWIGRQRSAKLVKADRKIQQLQNTRAIAILRGEACLKFGCVESGPKLSSMLWVIFQLPLRASIGLNRVPTTSNVTS